jgi:hypothetical protein
LIQTRSRVRRQVESSYCHHSISSSARTRMVCTSLQLAPLRRASRCGAPRLSTVRLS